MEQITEGKKAIAESQVIETKMPEENQDMMEGMYLTFLLDDQSYGLEVRYVIEIVRMQTITEVPDVADYIKGVINLRGKVIPVMDIRKRFSLEEKEYNERTCIIVVRVDDSETGLIVDTMQDVVDIPANKIQEPATLDQSAANRFIEGLGKLSNQVHVLLDAKSIVGFE